MEGRTELPQTAELASTNERVAPRDLHEWLDLIEAAGELKRISAPVSTGMPISHPIWALSHSYSPLSTRNVIRTPYIIQAANAAVNAKVFIPRTVYARRRSPATELNF